MVKQGIFVIILIIFSIFLEIRTHQKKRVIIASSGLYALVLYFVLFDLFKDNTVMVLLVKFRPDLLIQEFIPKIINFFTTSQVERHSIFMRLLDSLGIKEGSRIFNLIARYRPSASVSPFFGLSIGTMYNVFRKKINDFFGWTSLDDYYNNMRQIAYIYVLILCFEIKIVGFKIVKDFSFYKKDIYVRNEHYVG